MYNIKEIQHRPEDIVNVLHYDFGREDGLIPYFPQVLWLYHSF
jgi:hypothetical protein